MRYPFYGFVALEGSIIAPDIVFSTPPKGPRRNKMIFFFAVLIVCLFIPGRCGASTTRFFPNGHNFPSSSPRAPFRRHLRAPVWANLNHTWDKEVVNELFRLWDQVRSMCMEIEPSTVKHTRSTAYLDHDTAIKLCCRAESRPSRSSGE